MTFKVKDGLSVAGNTIIDGSGNVTVPGKTTVSNTTASGASLNLGTGTADPSTPVAGDFWYNTGALKVRQAAATKTVAYTDSTITGNAANVTGTVAVANGGTNGSATPTSGAVSYGTGTAYGFTAAGTSGQVLTSAGTGAPAWASQSTLSVGNATNATTAAACSGNSSTATTLQTARTINGVSFNGSADITVAAAAGTLTGATLASGVTASSLTSVGTLSSLSTSGSALFNGATQIAGSNSAIGIAYAGGGSLYGITLKPAADNSTVMNVFNAAGTAVGSITQSASAISFNGNATSSSSCSGNSLTATTLQTARNINGVSFNGSANITITAASPQAITRGTYLTGSNYDGSAATTWAVDADTANTASKVVARDASGNFSAGTITASLTGSATQLGGIAAASYVRTDTAQSITARKTFSGNQASVMATATGSLGAFEVYGDGTNAAFIAFHRPGAFASYLGIDTDNVLKYGGWSESTNAYPVVLARGTGTAWNISVSGSSTSCSGNANTATTLATARAINGVSFNGSAAITITAATPSSLSPGSYISGSAFNGSAAQTWNINAAEASTVSTVVARNASGDINVRLVRSEFANESTISGGIVFRVNNTTDNYMRTCSDAAAIRTFIGAYSSANPSGYTSNTGTVTGVTAAAPVVSSGGTAPQISMAAASSGVNGYMTGAYATKLDGIATGATNVTNTNQLTNGAGYITSSGRAYPRKSDGGSIDFYYSGQSGQPTYLWGTNDGTSMYVYNPSNFSVNYATSAGTASTSSAVTITYNNDSNASYQMLWGSGNGVYGTAGITCNPSTDSLTVAGSITATGNITAYSDRSVKENIEVIPNALNKVSSLSGYTFDRTDIDTPRQTGVIAQEVLEVLPEAVILSEEGKYSVAYGNMVGLLIEAIKELNAKVDSLQSQLDNK